MSKKILNLNRVFNVVSLVIVAMLSFICLSEWYNVEVLEKTEGYPFGSEGSVPYYYKSVELFVFVNQVWGLILLGVLILSIIIFRFGKQRIKLFMTFIIWIIIFLKIAHIIVA